jgi:hypothetical protein
VNAASPSPARTPRSWSTRSVWRFLPDLYAWTSFENAWTQRYAVATLCRILHTFDEGRVSSNHGRRLSWDPHERPRPDSFEQTLAFLEYVQRRVGVKAGSR